jgi:hypothetical protein
MLERPPEYLKPWNHDDSVIAVGQSGSNRGDLAAVPERLSAVRSKRREFTAAASIVWIGCNGHETSCSHTKRYPCGMTK